MKQAKVELKTTGIILKPDPTRVLLRPWVLINNERTARVQARVMALTDAEAHELLEEVMKDFAGRHPKLREQCLQRFEDVKHLMLTDRNISEERKLLIGSYFMYEYSLESSALFNPSIVPHFDQSDVPAGGLRFIMSLRAIGEGHISSIIFRSGMIAPNLAISVDPPSRFVTEPRPTVNWTFDKTLFERKLYELDMQNEFTKRVLANLRATFTMRELTASMTTARRYMRHLAETKFTADGIMVLAQSNYEVQFSPDVPLHERAIFPVSPTQINGIEDARFVWFTNDDGSRVYYATYTAYDGKLILPQLLETTDFLHFKFSTLNGPGAKDKDMALFPRKVNGYYAMLSRQDDENILFMHSENTHFWYEPQVIVRPTYPWQFVKIGSCSVPIETEQGWLVLTHGVGPVRKYCIDAVLLDRNDPTRLLARLREPLLAPVEALREGYVPNVVFTCGALLHGDQFIIPYAISDNITTLVTIPLNDLLGAMEKVESV
jgi:predicted GH43/DUF377 family glycosyl hydrolase